MMKKRKKIQSNINKNSKKSLFEYFQSLSKINKIIILIVFVFTFIRIYIQVKMPLYLQAGAGFDDFLLVSYAKSILKGEWLGIFGPRTLAKGISYPIFLIIAYLLGIPYSFALIGIYIFAIVLFIIVIKKYISNKYYLLMIYLALLYSPVMFHIENVQKIYRGGVITAFALIVISAMIGLYNSKSENIKKMLSYSIIASFALPFFYYLKEDSIWIMPFVLGAMVLTFIYVASKKINKFKTRCFLTLMPLISLIISHYAYCAMNYFYYGEFTITDRTGTYFKEVMADIIMIDEKNEIENIWITKDMMYKALEVSPTLQTIKENIDDMYENSFALVNGQFEGDMIFWTFKEAVGDAGIYKKGGKYVNNFYKKIDQELDKAYDDGKLKVDADNKIYLSSIATGFTLDELVNYYLDVTPKSIDMLITYNENETSLHNAYGQYPDIVFMDDLTNSVTVWPEEMSNSYAAYNIIIIISNKIVSFYQKTGHLVFILGIIGLITFFIRIIKSIFKKSYQDVDLGLILLGIFATCVALIFGVEWFVSWCGGSLMRHVYNYTCGIVPLLQILEITGIYFLLKEMYQILIKKKFKRSK